MDPRHATWLVVDTETTGIDPNYNGVCQIAGVWICGTTILHRFESLVNPGRHIPPDASAVHHLTDKHVKDARDFKAVFEEMLASGPEFDAWAAHNAEFDFGFVPAGDKPVLCTMQLAKKLWDSPHYSNQYLRYALKLDIEEVEGMPAHSALPDALVTAHLLMLELKDLDDSFHKYGTGITSLVKWTNEPNLLDIVAFGKHKGQKWSSVPKGYLSWGLENLTMDKDLEHTLRHYLGKR